MRKISSVITCILFSVFYSCDRPEYVCRNPVFNEFPPEAREYKAELVKQLQINGAGNISYWAGKYMGKEGKAYMTVCMQGGGLCDKGILDISDTTGGGIKLKSYRRVKGRGYSGAGLSGLKYRIDSTNGSYNFVFEAVDGIID